MEAAATVKYHNVKITVFETVVTLLQSDDATIMAEAMGGAIQRR